MTAPKPSPSNSGDQAGDPLEEPLGRVLAEQRAAAAYLSAHPHDRGAQVWLNDWVAEEILTRRV